LNIRITTFEIIFGILSEKEWVFGNDIYTKELQWLKGREKRGIGFREHHQRRYESDARSCRYIIPAMLYTNTFLMQMFLITAGASHRLASR